jgi:hypothetical protein
MKCYVDLFGVQGFHRLCGPKNSRISAARISGCSIAAKWPPFDIVLQC